MSGRHAAPKRRPIHIPRTVEYLLLVTPLVLAALSAFTSWA